MASLQGVLLDIDGTLVDSNDAHANAWVRVLSEYGFDVPFEKVRRLIGKGGDKLLPEATGLDADSRKGKAISQRRGELFQQEYLPHLRAFPGATDLLARLKNAGLRLVVASSAKSDELHGLLRVCQADDFIEARTSSDDASRSKPDPDIVEAALGKTGLIPGEVIMLGDTPYDVEAAGRAGVGCVAFRCGGWNDADLQGALAIYDGPNDLLAKFETSPLAKR
jgi:HAD superfamily hydrolase (TIGR01509 family)